MNQALSDLLGWLLGLDTLSFGGDGVALAWERPWASWIWAVLLAGCILLAWWTYRRLEGSFRARFTLGTLRGLALLVVLVMLSGPMLTEESQRTEPDWIVVLADRSASMDVRDVQEGVSRDQQLRELVRTSWPAWAERSTRSRVLWLGFDSAAFDLAPVEGGINLGEADGIRTDVATALASALDRTAARSVAGVVVLSDGRSVGAPDAPLWDRLRAQGTPIFAVPLGASGVTRDLSITATGPQRAFVEDAVPIAVRIDRVADDGEITMATARLIDSATGLLLDERRVEVGPQGADVLLQTTPQEAGSVTWRVELSVDGGDLIAENNTQDLSVQLVDEPLRVVYIDGSPRWEHRYLKNLLLREDSVTSSSLLLAANRRFTQEGNVALVGLPRSPEEWAEIDVVILGDVRPELLGDEVLSQLRDHVATRGAGLIWIGGPASTPHRYRGTALGALLPFTVSEQARMAVWSEPVTMARSEGAEAMGVLRLGDRVDEPWPAQLRDPATGWSRLWGVQQISIDQLKPAAVPLAFAITGAESADDQWPIVMTMRYGAGRSVYMATDETWRWRYGLGDLLFDRFWLPIIRLAGRESLARLGTEVAVTIEPREPLVGQPATVEVRLLDQSLIDAATETLVLELQRVGDQEPRRVTVRRRAEGDATYIGSWIPQEPGEHRVRSGTPLLAGIGLDQSVTARVVDDERRDPRPDHALLASLAERTGGRVVPPDELSTLPELIPNRAVVLDSPPTIEILWDKPLVLILLITLLTAEWLGRRLLRLA